MINIEKIENQRENVIKEMDFAKKVIYWLINELFVVTSISNEEI